MEEFRLGDQLVLFDRQATAIAYSAMPFGDADRCACIYCRNFAAQRAKIYPPGFLALLDRFGIDPDKEGEVFDSIGPFEDVVRPIGGWFYFVGKLTESGEKLIQSAKFQYWIQPSFPRPPAYFGETVAAVEFAVEIPWVLKESSG